MKSWPLGDLTLEVFLSEYWQKKPLLIRQALPSLSPPLAGDELAGLACEDNVESRLIIQDPVRESWDLTHGPLSEELFKGLPKSHWTLLVQAVDHWVPSATQLLAQFSFIPNWRVDDLMISYSSDQGGVGPHYDHYDVFLVQASGRRQWEIGGVCDEGSPRRPDTPVKILLEWEPEQRWILEPGDLLYVPPCIGHSGVAIGDDCMTCSVGFRAPSHGELIQAFGDYVVEITSEGIRYTDPDLLPQANPGQITEEAVKKAQAILRQYVDDQQSLAKWFGQYMTKPKYLEEESDSKRYTPEQVVQFWNAGQVINRNEGSRFAYQFHGSEWCLFVDGRLYHCGEPEADLVKALCAELKIHLLQFAQTDTGVQLLSTLLTQGSVYVPEQDDSLQPFKGNG